MQIAIRSTENLRKSIDLDRWTGGISSFCLGYEIAKEIKEKSFA